MGEAVDVTIGDGSKVAFNYECARYCEVLKEYVNRTDELGLAYIRALGAASTERCEGLVPISVDHLRLCGITTPDFLRADRIGEG